MEESRRSSFFKLWVKSDLIEYIYVYKYSYLLRSMSYNLKTCFLFRIYYREKTSVRIAWGMRFI